MPSLQRKTDVPVRQAASAETGLLARFVLVVALTLTLVGAMRWAYNITGVNARQISSNLMNLQDRFGQPPPVQQRAARQPQRAPAQANRPGPTIEAVR